MLVVVISSGATIMIEPNAVAVCGEAAESIACTVKLKVPVVVGVPEIAPVDVFRFNPDGKDPVATIHVYGAVPPVALRVAPE